MDYKSLMGFNKKKKEAKKTILENIQEELGYKKPINEVGAAPLYRKHIKNIEKAHMQYSKSVFAFYELLRKQGVDDQSLNLLTRYKDTVIKFGLEFKKLVRKLL